MSAGSGVVVNVRPGNGPDWAAISVILVPPTGGEQLVFDGLVHQDLLPACRTALDTLLLLAKMPVVWSGVPVAALELDDKAKQALKLIKRIL